MNKLEAIIICVNYSDFLEITLPINLKQLDHAIIITSPKDIETKKVLFEKIESDKVSLLVTDAFYENGAKFNKGLVINQGYFGLKYKDWIMNLDCDILLSDNFKEEFFKLNPDKEKCFGSRRIDIPTKEDYQRYLSREKKIEDFICYRGSGYGYHCIYNYNSYIFQKLLKIYQGFPYPYWFDNGSESDWVFRNNYGERIFNPPLGKFPECHLEKENDYNTGLYEELPMRVIHLGQVGVNHNERITEKFI